VYLAGKSNTQPVPVTTAVGMSKTVAGKQRQSAATTRVCHVHIQLHIDWS